MSSLIERIEALEAQVATLKSEKLNKSGGTITGHVAVEGDVTVHRLKALEEVAVYENDTRVMRLHRSGTILTSEGHALVRAKIYQVIDDSGNAVKELD